jgi:TatD DNase family protein
MKLIDTHCHIDVQAFDKDRDQVLRHARESGVTRLIVPAITAAGWNSLLALCANDAGLYPALGLHPVFTDQHHTTDVEQLGEAVQLQRPVAIGEIGLDFYIDAADRERQQQLLEAQLDIARQFDLPVILHVRKAHEQILSTLKRIPVRGGTAHAFNGSLQQAQQYIDMGFKLGFGGMLTYERSSKLRKLARELPADSLVMETDAPDMAGAGHHGTRNSPEYLPEYLHTLARIRDVDPQQLAQQTTENAMAVFGLNELPQSC